MTLDRKDYKSAIPQLEKRLSAVEKVGDKSLANFDVLQDLLEKEIHERERQYLKQDTSINTITVKMYYIVKDAGTTPATDDVGWSETMPKLDYSNDDKVLWYMSKTFRNGAVIETSTPQQVQLMDGVFSFINSVSGDAGWTTINGDTISTGRIQDHTGDNYFDLDDGTFNFGDGTHYVRQVGNGVEIKADLDVLSTVGNTTLSGMVSDMSDFAQDVIDINNDIDDLQNQIDGNITTWFYGYVPTLSNAPASSWSTDTDKDNHLGDLFYDTTTGYAYRFMKENGTYSWAKITDSDVTEALRLAGEAQDTADHKRRVFVSTPVPPYDIGDLWAEGSSGDIKKCKTAKADGQSYSASDWELASKYTDDTAVTNFASRFSVTPEAISSEVTATQDGNTLTTRINQNATTVKIQASKVQVDGTLIVGASDVDNAISNTSVGDLSDGSNYSTTSQMNSAIATAKADAEKTATNYLTTISGTTGISVHSANDTSNFANVNSSGMTVYKGGTKVATFGDTATIGKTNSTNTVIDSSGLSIKNGSTNLAKFNAGNISIGSSVAGTEISTAGAIGMYPSGGTTGLRMSKINGVTTFTYDGLYFSSQPYVKARSTNANISLSSSTITKVPMTYIDDQKGNGGFMSVNNGNVQFDYFDGITVEATASAYVQPSSNAFVYIFLYRYDASNNTTTEVGAGCNYISSTYGGVVQLTPRIITDSIFANDYLYISVRCIGTTGTAYCNHKDTFLTVKYM